VLEQRHQPSVAKPAAPEPVTPLHQPLLHESGAKHVTGEAQYVDDFVVANVLVAQVLTSPHAHAKILRIDTARAKQVPGVHAVYTHHDVPGENNVGPVIHDEPLFASDTVQFMGQSIAVVIGET
jgi:xanthine dehydrogenase large subunit